MIRDYEHMKQFAITQLVYWYDRQSIKDKTKEKCLKRYLNASLVQNHKRRYSMHSYLFNEAMLRRV